MQILFFVLIAIVIFILGVNTWLILELHSRFTKITITEDNMFKRIANIYSHLDDLSVSYKKFNTELCDNGTVAINRIDKNVNISKETKECAESIRGTIVNVVSVINNHTAKINAINNILHLMNADIAKISFAMEKVYKLSAKANDKRKKQRIAKKLDIEALDKLKQDMSNNN